MLSQKKKSLFIFTQLEANYKISSNYKSYEHRKGYEMKVIKSNKVTNKFKVSILISTYNKEKFIENTLNSILAQTMNKNDFELIIVDDC